MTEAPQPPVAPTPPQGLKPHRGTTVLVLGILGFCCAICGIIAWVMGKNDLKEMASGQMDPAGEGATKAGKICGMISVILACVWLSIWLIFFVILAGTATTTIR